MTYLPPTYTQDTVFPEAFDRDVLTQLDMIDEMAARTFPIIRYYSLKRETGIAAEDPVTGGPAPVGAAGNSTFDTLYGETVDPALAGQAWQQPHLNTTIKAGTVEVDRFADPVDIRCRVQREARDYDLKKWGFDEMRDILVHVPTRSLDRLGLTVAPGDKFVWDGDEYEVLQDRDTGYWKNTNLSMWRSVMAEHRRRSA